MAECIEREAVFSAIWKTSAEHDVFFPAIILDAIKSIPAADVRPVARGVWIRGNGWSEGCGMGESYGFYYECSACKNIEQGGYKNCGMHFCPNCGADMREPPKEEST